jgi:hypothetical protein
MCGNLVQSIIADHGPRLGGPRDGLRRPIETPIEESNKGKRSVVFAADPTTFCVCRIP